MNLKGVELTAELMEKLNEVETLEELKAVVKEIGLEISEEELAEYFDEEMNAIKLPAEDLNRVAGGNCKHCPNHCLNHCELDHKPCIRKYL